MIARMFFAFPIVLIAFGVGITIWWIADRFWRFVRWAQKDSSQ